MKKLIFSSFFIVALNSTSYANDVIEFNIVGSIVATTCNITTPSQTINLGAWQTQTTSGIGSGVGSKSDMVEYTLDFDCPKGLKLTAQLEGNRNSPSSIYDIGLEKSEQSATGVVIEMHSYLTKWQSIIYDTPRTLISKTVDGINSVLMRSFYMQSEDTITPGIANSSVTLTITYQ